MRKLLLFLIFASLAFGQASILMLNSKAGTGGGGGITVLGTPSCSGSSNQNNVSLTYSSAGSANFIAVLVSDFGANPSSANISTSSPTLSESWQTVASPFANTLGLFYIKNVTDAASSMTFTYTASGTYPSICVLAASGVNASSPEDGAMTNNGGSNCASTGNSPCNAGSITPSGTDLFIWGTDGDNSGTFPTGYTLGSSFSFSGIPNSGNNFSAGIGYKVSSSAENPALTYSGSPNIYLLLKAFKP